jgi:hypothetical protein
MDGWRVAKSLIKLRDQIDAAAPNRSKANDGTIGDERHASRTSDHNAWVMDGRDGVVTGMDITHDPKHGVDSYKLADALRKAEDPRIKYLISNSRIANPDIENWKWRPYNGANPHDCHVHISVKPEKNLYDSEKAWRLHEFVAQPDAPQVVDHPLLRRGSEGEDVRRLQAALGIAVDGDFARGTEKAVREFQKAHGLPVDGIVGNYTWRELLKAKPTTPKPLTDETFVRITATVFGGKIDDERSAYDGHHIGDDELAVALPARFSGRRPRVEVTNQATGKRVVCTIEDVGPWEEHDPYWERTGGRPKAESGKDTRGRTTNRAGIDLSPAAARAIGLNGMGKVNWRFV